LQFLHLLLQRFHFARQLINLLGQRIGSGIGQRWRGRKNGEDAGQGDEMLR